MACRGQYGSAVQPTANAEMKNSKDCPKNFYLFQFKKSSYIIHSKSS